MRAFMHQHRQSLLPAGNDDDGGKCRKPVQRAVPGMHGERDDGDDDAPLPSENGQRAPPVYGAQGFRLLGKRSAAGALRGPVAVLTVNERRVIVRHGASLLT